jgi:hypothetical protein
MIWRVCVAAGVIVVVAMFTNITTAISDAIRALFFVIYFFDF